MSAQAGTYTFFFLETGLTLALFCYFFVWIGILKNENGAPEDEENFEEAIKNVNTALNTTQVSKEGIAETNMFSDVFVCESWCNNLT